MFIDSRSQLHKISRYLTIGGLVFVSYYSLLAIFYSYLGFVYSFAIAISLLLAAIIHFFLNRIYTFNVNDRQLFRSILRYTCLAIFNYFFQLAIVYFLFKIKGLNFYISAFIGVIATTMIGFLTMQFWIFQSEQPELSIIKTPRTFV